MNPTQVWDSDNNNHDLVGVVSIPLGSKTRAFAVQHGRNQVQGHLAYKKQPPHLRTTIGL